MSSKYSAAYDTLEPSGVAMQCLILDLRMAVQARCFCSHNDIRVLDVTMQHLA